MPLDLVRAIDDALAELVDWRTRKLRFANRDASHTEREAWLWSGLPTKPVDQICRLLLSPVFYALCERLFELGIYGWEDHSTGSLIVAGIVLLSLVRYAEPLIPFRNIRITSWHLLPALIFILFLIRYLYRNQTSVFNSHLILLDAFSTPLIGHLLNDMTDREQIHYFFYGTIISMSFDLTMIALMQTRSLLWTVATGLGVAVVVQTVVKVMVVAYLVSVPIDLLSNFYTPPLVKAFVRVGLQRMLFTTNRFLRTIVPTLVRGSGAEPSSATSRDLGAAELYQYSALPTGCMRLLRLCPGRPSEPIRCEFVVSPQAQSGPYEAISYVWGHPAMSESIIVHGKPFNVTTSAYAIMLQRRSRSREQIIWIDQVCINQADLEEKANQVRAMNNIFRRASLVSAWLGPSQDAHHVQRVFAQLHFLREGRGWSGEKIRDYILNQAYSNEQRVTAELRAVAEFFRNPWFYRVWIVQEAAVAKKLHVIYGGICMDWIHIGRAVAVLFDSELISLLHVPGLLQGDEFHDNALLRRPVATGLQNADTLFFLHGDIDYDLEFTLAQLLRRCAYFNSTDPRDRVFALLGLATDDSAKAISPDYEVSPCQVYTLTATYLLKRSKDPLDVLRDAGIGLRRGLHDLPSWVPDWSYVSRGSFVSRGFAASPLKVASVRFDKSASVIHMDGMIIDSVTRLSSTYEVRIYGLRIEEAAILEQWLNEVETLATETAASLQDEDTLGHAVFRTIVAGRLDRSDSKLTAKQCKDGYTDLTDYFAKALPLLRLVNERNRQHPSGHAALDDLKVDEAKDAELCHLSERFRQLQEFIESASGGRRFCVTKALRMAIVPEYSQEGDFVCIMNGAKMPCILRRKVASTRKCYEFVGCCYVDGVMEAEGDVDVSASFTLV
jgi:hypothetical protein